MAVLFALLFWLGFVLLFWTYFGYPLLMALWSRLRAQPIVRAEITPALTLLIPVFNESDVLRQKLENSLALDYPKDRLQILVVDDGSDDGSAEISAAYAARGVTIVRQITRQGKMAAVNAGFAQAQGEIVVLSDASPLYHADALRKLVRAFADPGVGVVVGALLTRDSGTGVAQEAGLYWRYESALRDWESRTGSTVAVHGNMFALRRSCFRPLAAGTINDEFSLALEAIRQGYRVVYEPEAISYDDASQTMYDEVKRRSRITAGRYQALFSAGYLRLPNANIAFRLISHKLLRPLAPLLMLAMLLGNLLALLLGGAQPRLLALSGGWGALVLAGQAAFYGLAALGWRAERRGQRPARLISIPYFFVSTNFAALIGLWRWLRGTQRVTWQKRAIR